MGEETEINIRKAKKKDAALLSALGVTTFFEAYFEQDDPRDLGDYCAEAFSLFKMQEELSDENSTFFLAEFRRKVVGYAKLRENSAAPGVENENAIELQRLYLLEKVKGKGIGTALMDVCFAEGRARGYKTIWLSVWRENKPAQRFYEKSGFKKVGELRFEYGANLETNYVLARKL